MKAGPDAVLKTPAEPLIAPWRRPVSILPCPPSTPVQRSAWTPCEPLLNLLRTTLAERGELTLRLLPADHEHAAPGYIDPNGPNGPVIGFYDNPDNVAFLTDLVLSLNQLSVADVDPRLEVAALEFALDSSRRTLAKLGVTAR